MALDRQVSLFKVDTSAFLSLEERAMLDEVIKWKRVSGKLRKRLKIPETGRGQDEYLKQLKKKIKTGEPLQKYERAWYTAKTQTRKKQAQWKEYIAKSSKERVDYNDTHEDKIIRELDERYLSYVDPKTGERKANLLNVISMFESSLTRSFNIKMNELTYDIFIVEIYYFDIAQDLIVNGFNYRGKHYVYFSSSAGQIRTKKAVFVNEERYLQCQGRLLCGLSPERINAKGGMNVNKYLAYIALANSATDLWEDVFGEPFDIDKTVVVDDFETMVDCVVDDIDDQTYKITPGVEKKIPIPHMDGLGIARKLKKNCMVRLPFIKGLLGAWDYYKFIEVNGCSPIIKDIWGKEYDVIKEDIQVIFTKSQFKMWKFYDSWDDYKDNFKKYGCEAAICNMEENYIPNATINYQMLQTLYDATDEEIKELCAVSNKKIRDIDKSLKNILEFFGVDLDNDEQELKGWFQKALKIYPELVTDPATRLDLSDLKKSRIKKYKGGHLEVQGKFTFVLPDLYAFCEWLFMGIEEPKGLIADGEVFCRLYPNSEKLDCLRSPHLYIEHAVRKNVYGKKRRGQCLRDWFLTDGIYTSVHDPISRILQFDVDGDKLLVIAQKLIISMAERAMQGVYPLYYEMKKANAEQITPHSTYNGLRLAFTGGRIGPISNDITKIWNSSEITEQSKMAVKWLCMETNFTIDYAKTLYKPVRPAYVDEILKGYSRQKTPYFFIYAKKKTEEQVEPPNNSTVNRITKEIKDGRYLSRSVKRLKKVDYLLMLKNKEDVYWSDEVNSIFNKWNKKYGMIFSIDGDEHVSKNNFNQIIVEIKSELAKVESDEDKVVNSLVAFLYKKRSTKRKKLFWALYGEKVYGNLVENVEGKNICRQCGGRTKEKLVLGKCQRCRMETNKKYKEKKIIICVDCGAEVVVRKKNNMTVRCAECQKKQDNRLVNEKMQKRIHASNIKNEKQF